VTAKNLAKDLEKLKDPKRNVQESRFFKTGKGEYGEGDIFWGVSVPEVRKLARKYFHLSFSELQDLLNSKVHCLRQTALIILNNRYQKSNDKEKKFIADFYLKNTKNINNWDLVDISAPNILGEWLLGKSKKILYKLAKSKNLWERRIAILATYGFIRKNQFKETLKIAEILLRDEHDLIHKAVGWMLREVGKKDLQTEKKFLNKHCQKMPRVMLRYAIEKFTAQERERYLTHKG